MTLHRRPAEKEISIAKQLMRFVGERPEWKMYLEGQ